MIEEQQTVDWDFPAWSERMFFPGWSYIVGEGGRGSSKSWTFGRWLIKRCYERRTRWLCTREIQKSIKDSVHKLLSDQIWMLGLQNEFVIQNTSITHLNGSEILFEGLKSNVNKIKSLEGLDGAWVEEAEKVSKNSWEVLIPTIRKEGSLILVSYNPDEETDDTYQRFHVNPPPNTLFLQVNWEDNPFFTEKMRMEKDYLYRVDPDAAEHIWGGKIRQRSDAQIFHGKWIVDSFEPQPTWSGPYFGGDWGFAKDPTTLVKLWYDPSFNDLYIEHEAYGVGVETQEISRLWKTVPGSLLMVRKDNGLVPAPQQYVIRADNSRPETITYVRHYGFNVQPCEKWSGSVEDGIAWLRSIRRIVIHQRCKHAQDEAKRYRYKIDKVTGDILPIVVDAHNHIWDPVRYAMSDYIRQHMEGVVVVDPGVNQIAPELDDMGDAPAWLIAN